MTSDTFKYPLLSGKNLLPSWIVPDPTKSKSLLRLFSRSQVADSGCALYKALKHQSRNG